MSEIKAIYDLRQETISVKPGDDCTVIKTVKLSPIDPEPRAIALSLIGIPRNIEWRFDCGTREEIIAHNELIKELANKISCKKHHLNPSIAFFDGGSYWLASELNNVALSQRTNAQCRLIAYYGTEQDAVAYATSNGHAKLKATT